MNIRISPLYSITLLYIYISYIYITLIFNHLYTTIYIYITLYHPYIQSRKNYQCSTCTGSSKGDIRGKLMNMDERGLLDDHCPNTQQMGSPLPGL